MEVVLKYDFSDDYYVRVYLNTIIMNYDLCSFPSLTFSLRISVYSAKKPKDP